MRVWGKALLGWREERCGIRPWDLLFAGWISWFSAHIPVPCELWDCGGSRKELPRGKNEFPGQFWIFAGRGRSSLLQTDPRRWRCGGEEGVSGPGGKTGREAGGIKPMLPSSAQENPPRGWQEPCSLQTSLHFIHPCSTCDLYQHRIDRTITAPDPRKLKLEWGRQKHGRFLVGERWIRKEAQAMRRAEDPCMEVG